jgi:hypothetical protein
VIIVAALPWQQVGRDLLASVLLDFSLDVDYQIGINGSIGSDYYEARSVDINTYQLAAGVTVDLQFNAVPHTIPPSVFQTYALSPHQRYITARCSALGASRMLLTFYPVARPEWR